MKQVLIAGATGYLGRFLCRKYQQLGWRVIALVRKSGKAADLSADWIVVAEATWAETLAGTMAVWIL